VFTSLLQLPALSLGGLLRGVVLLLVSVSEDRHRGVSAEINHAWSKRELHRFLDGDGREGLTCERESFS